LVVLTVSTGISGAYTSYQIQKEYRIHARNLQQNEQVSDFSDEITPVISLTREGENVVVLFLDRAINSYFPIILEQFPELASQYSGFVYYPNTVSYGAHTISGAPPIMGGYEYTPDEMNARDKERLVDKHNESSLVLPILFSDAGYLVRLFNPPYSNYKGSGDYSVFQQYPEIDVMQLDGKLKDRYKRDHSDVLGGETAAIHTLIEQRLPVYALFKIVLPALRSLLYDEGRYFLMQDSPHKLEYFLDAFSTLYYLPELTDTDSNVPSYSFLVNDSTHRAVFLQAPYYEPQSLVTDIASPLQSNPIYKLHEESHYHINAASILQVGKWLEYLKNKDVYDNTRIIIVADHGYNLSTPVFSHFKRNAKTYAYYNPLLLVKDFNTTGEIITDNQFMTNADVPIFALTGIVENPENPFTGNSLTEAIQKEEVNVYKIPYNPSSNRGNTFDLDLSQSFTIKNNIFIEDNWKPISSKGTR